MQIQARPDIQTMDLIGPMLVAILFICYVDEALPRILEDAELPLSGSFRVLLAQLQLEVGQLTARIEEMDRVIQQTAKEDEACQRLTTIPGVGPVTATALIASVGNGSAFRGGRGLAAWVGMVPGDIPLAASRSCWGWFV